MNFGQIGQFDHRSESFTEYRERLEFYFIANQVDDVNRRKAIFLTSIGPHQYRLLRDLSAPTPMTEKTFSELCQLMKEHFEPTPQKYVQRTKFESRNRQPSETVGQYIAALRHLSEHCEFGNSLEERLTERLVRGINDERIQRRLLSEVDLTLQKATRIAQAVVLSESGARDLLIQPPPASHEVNYLRRRRGYPSAATASVTPTHNKSSAPAKYHSASSSAPTKHHVASSSSSKCQRCGMDHRGIPCKHTKSKCHSCSKIGHLAKMCKSKPFKRLHNVNEEPDDDSLFGLCQTSNDNPSSKAVWITISVNSKDVEFQLDTGASTTVIPATLHNNVFSECTLERTTVSLKTYTGDKVRVLGEFHPNVSYQKQSAVLPLVVVDSTGPPLLGRNWLNHIKLDWHQLFHFQSSNDKLDTVIAKYDVFNNDAGCLKNHIQRIHLRENAQPIFKKARHPPFALRDKIESELDRLVKTDIIEKVEFSDWATPIVPILKSDGSLRLCGDYKVTVNQVIAREEHPIPRIDELANKLAHGEKFSTIDFSHAYTHIALDRDSQNITTINTHCGLYRYKRLPFGISSCPAIFQRTIESVFSDIPNTVVYFDNLYLTGSNDEEHLQTLESVLKRCKERGLNIKQKKCEFLKDEIDFLGYRLTQHGISPQPKKVEAIYKAPPPTNVHELKAYLGMINYYAKFLPNISHRLSPLYDLLKKNTIWKWESEQQTSFEDSKKCLSSTNLLVHFDPNNHVVLTCDASPRGVSAILSHRFHDGSEKPIAYASRSLDKAERNYSQLDKEALALVFGIRKFHKYVYGRHITIKTDHKPLLGLLGEKKPIPEHASSRVQRWAIMMSAYDYKLEHVPGHRNNADALSRLPLPVTAAPTPFPEDLHQVFLVLDDSPTTSTHIALATAKDPILKSVYDIVAHGHPWPSNINENLRPYYSRRSELSVENGCLLWGIRVVIPTSLQQKILSLIHEEHIGIVRMKMLARSYVWWPKMDYDLELCVKSCFACQSLRNDPPHAPLHSWDWPNRPWSRIHIDFAGPFLSHMFLIIIDSHSKWMEIKIMKRITASDTISQLRSVFAFHGIPDRLVSDNGATFTSQEFSDFMRHNGIEHITSAPYHPSTNGLAERAVGTFKQAMKKMSGGTVFDNVNKFLIKYRTTPQTSTGVTPAELIFGRKLKTRLDLIHENVCKNVEKSQTNQKYYHDNAAKFREFAINDNVFVKNQTSNNPKYLPASIVKQTGPVSYKVLSNGVVKRCHVDQILPTHVDTHAFNSNQPREREEGVDNDASIESKSANINTHDQNNDSTPEIIDIESPNPNISISTEEVSPFTLVQTKEVKEPAKAHDSMKAQSVALPVVRRSGRTIKPPNRLTL